MPDEECTVCGPGVVHKPDMIHPYTPDGGSKRWLGARRDRNDGKTAPRATQGAETVPVASSWPFDPVLRQALIDKGVLTPDDLRDAERKIHEMSVVFNQGGLGGKRQVQE